MLFHIGSPPNSLTDAELASGEWQRLSYPSIWIMQLLALPAGASMAFVALVTWTFIEPNLKVNFAPPYQVILVYILINLAGLLIQTLTYPGMGLNPKTVVGVWPSRLTWYTCHLSSSAKKWRLISTLTLPLIVLTLLPMALVSVPWFSVGWLFFWSCLSAFLYGLNGVLALWVAIRLPRGSIVAGRDFQLYWKLQE